MRFKVTMIKKYGKIIEITINVRNIEKEIKMMNILNFMYKIINILRISN